MTTDPKKILIVDDEVSFTRLLKLNLEQNGAFEVRVENRAMAAVASAREFKPDLVLLDVIMPQLDGGQVASRFKADPLLTTFPSSFSPPPSANRKWTPIAASSAASHSSPSRSASKRSSSASRNICPSQRMSNEP